MTSGPDLPQRKSIRLQGFEYAQAGAYFVTICTQGKRCLLSSIVGKSVELTLAGEIVRAVWNSLPERFPRLVLDEFVIMPNHLHGVLGLVGAGLAPPAVNPGKDPANMAKAAPPGAATTARNYSLPDVMGAFKSISTIQVNKRLQRKGIPLWQRSYYEHIIRKGEDLRKIQQYILENPLNWALDTENPHRSSA
jgi:REP element-mobilizing transposase RayT